MFQLMVRLKALFFMAACVSSAIAEANNSEFADIAVNEVRVLPSCAKCRELPIVCVVGADKLTNEKLVARNKMNRVVTIFAGEVRQLGSVSVRCGSVQVQNIDFYIEFGCSSGMTYYRERMDLNTEDFDDNKITDATERRLADKCHKQGRELYFNALGGLPKIVRTSHGVTSMGEQ